MLNNGFPTITQQDAHIRQIVADRDHIVNDHTPDNKTDRIFGLPVHNWEKLRLDNTFMPGLPEHQCKKSWIKSKPMKDAFSKKTNNNRHN